jgi:hypothetical protein
MTCKAGREFLRKLAMPTTAAIALMLCTTLPARPQAIHGQLDGVTIMYLADGNEYSCDLGLVFTPSQITNWHCQATLTTGTPVEHAVSSEGYAVAIINTPFGPGEIEFPVDVVERPDGTANVEAHF